ncbi:DUF4012 domain-containing protein [Microbacterium indicum]|uniref:DUF4012 domain-containing protein n=1 Tax=Microbacterium indicum TaxID=358100 RepID=UPI0003F766E2|nr:DUF4012 domain-containing protein [Microbacterium indicum]
MTADSGSTRRQLREAAPGPQKKRHTGRWVLLGIGILVLVVIVWVVWLGIRVVQVRGDLTSAQSQIAKVQDDPSTVGDSLGGIGEHAAAAASAAGDPIWRASEWIPWAGDNLRGVRLASQSLDVLVNDLARPALGAIDGGGDAPVLETVLPYITDSAPEITELAGEVHDVAASDSLIGPVRSGVDMVDQVMSATSPFVAIMPDLLGADGAKNYLLVFQNNAESVGLGGSAASQTLLSADGGDLSITAQASSADYDNHVGNFVDVDIPDSANQLYGDYYGSRVNMAPARPDFPSMAEQMRAFWNRDIGDQQIDGVLSIDPIALSYILEATGPLELATGDEMTADNAVQLLLSDVYTRWDSMADGDVVDAFFASVAGQVFDKIATGDFDIPTMISSVGKGIDQGSILFHSFDDSVQQVIQDDRIAGILPTSNDTASTVGVYLRDESSSKIDYYMKSAIDVAQTCSDGGSTFQVATTLHMDISQADADALPAYVMSGNWGSSQFRTTIYVYGPPGTTVGDVQIDGRDVTVLSTDVDDLGRPVAAVQAYLQPTEQATVTATFSGDGDFGPADVWSTPMVNATDTTVEACGE